MDKWKMFVAKNGLSEKIFLVLIIFFFTACNFSIPRKTNSLSFIKNKFSNKVWESTVSKYDYFIFDEIIKSSDNNDITCFIIKFQERPDNTIKISENGFSFVFGNKQTSLCSSRTGFCENVSLNENILTLMYRTDDGTIVTEKYKKSNRSFSDTKKLDKL